MQEDHGLRANHDAIDRTVLADLCGGDQAFERRILANFANAVRTDAQRLRAAVESREMNNVSRVAHSIKGASRTVGAYDLGHVCERIEQAGRVADAANVQASLAAFEREVARAESCIESILGPDAADLSAAGKGSR